MDLLGDRTGELIAGRYRLDRAIGRGGMGAVYAATHVELGRRVAVKLLLPHFAAEPELLERFRRESLASASLQHANIVQVIDFGRAADGAPFLVMELLDGATFTRALATPEALPWPRLAAITLQLLGALSIAHASGIVHRDIKPDNVFLVPLPGVGELVKLLDFGIAKLTDGATYRKLTETGMVLGTPVYMSPEQMLGERIDARTDLYAVGVVLYRALAGQPPYRGDNPGALLKAVLDGTPEPLARLRPDLPPAVVALVERAMARLPAHRFQSADAMLAAMNSLGAPAANTAPRAVVYATRVSAAAPPPRASRRAWYGAALGVACALVLGAVALYGVAMLRGGPGAKPATASTTDSAPTGAAGATLAAQPGGFVPTVIPGQGEARSGQVTVTVRTIVLGPGYPSTNGIALNINAGMQMMAICLGWQDLDFDTLPDAITVNVMIDPSGGASEPMSLDPDSLPAVVRACAIDGATSIRLPRPQRCMPAQPSSLRYCSSASFVIHVARGPAR